MIHATYETSRAAERMIKPHRHVLREKVLIYAERHPRGFTDHELCQFFGNHSSSYRTRRSELASEGIIVATEERRTLPSGRSAVVWQLVDLP
jgi:hypothetical protein